MGYVTTFVMGLMHAPKKGLRGRPRTLESVGGVIVPQIYLELRPLSSPLRHETRVWLVGAYGANSSSVVLMLHSFLKTCVLLYWTRSSFVCVGITAADEVHR